MKCTGLFKRTSAVLILIFAVLSCQSVGQKKSSVETDTEAATKDKLNLAIIPYSLEMFWVFKDAKATKLSRSELEQVGEILINAVIEYNKNIHDKYFRIKLRDKKSQYVAVISKAGEKEVWLNFFCDDFDTDWRNEIVQVFDGGNCYFNLKINLTTKQAYDLMVNGYA